MITQIPAGRTRAQLDRLLAHEEGPKVTIRHVPFESVDEDPAAGRLRLEGLLDTARSQLDADDQAVLEPAAGLVEEAIGDRRDCTVVLWLARELAEATTLPRDGAPPPGVHVGDWFLASDLILASLRWPPYVVAAVDRRGGRLVAVGSDRLVESEELEPPSIPMDEPEVQLQHHSVGRAGATGAPVTFHGHGGAKDVSSEPTRRILHGLAEKVDDRLRGGSLPLVLAAGPDLVGEWADALTYPHVLEEHLTMNPEGKNDSELAAAAQPLVVNWVAGRQAEQRERIGGRRPGDGWATGPKPVVDAVDIGRVDTLFVNEAGVRDPDMAVATDHAIVATWRQDGEVVLVADDSEPVVEARLRW